MRIKLVKNKNYPELKRLYAEFEVAGDGDICVAVGGDGTFVKAAKNFSGPILPIRSNDPGSVGYYADISISDIDLAIDCLKTGDYVIEKLSNKIELSYKGRKYYAVNEVLLSNLRGEVSFKVYQRADGRRRRIYPYVMSGDGIIISSLIGSTAYNKSAGGPILLSPKVVCITFLNVDGPYKNPIVADSSTEFEIVVEKYNGTLRYDGINVATLNPGESFRAKLSRKELKVIRLDSKREEFSAKLERIVKSRMMKDSE